MKISLANGDRVGIIGGGPAGSFAALNLLHLIKERGLELEIMIFETRQFSRPGPSGCNRCAGILSTSLLNDLTGIGIELPEDLVQARINAYSIEIERESLSIERPDPSRNIVSIYRGGGPRLRHGEPVLSFDGFLLDQACSRGARHVARRVRSVEWDQRPIIITDHERMPVDLLVLACGVNSRAPLTSAFGYLPPRTAIMAQDELLRPGDWPSEQVSAYFRYPPGLMFGALIPKGNYLNVSLLGKKLATDAISEFLEAQGLTEAFADQPASLCGCTPRIAIRASRRYYGTRWVAVGDASVTRLYKDGIGTAFSTAREAMKSAVERGVSAAGFRRGYLPLCRRIARDNLYGRILFRMWAMTLEMPRLRAAWVRALKEEDHLPPEERIHGRIIWGMFTGDEPYRDLFRLAFSAGAMRPVWRKLGLLGGADG